MDRITSCPPLPTVPAVYHAAPDIRQRTATAPCIKPSLHTGLHLFTNLTAAMPLAVSARFARPGSWRIRCAPSAASLAQSSTIASLTVETVTCSGRRITGRLYANAVMIARPSKRCTAVASRDPKGEGSMFPSEVLIQKPRWSGRSLHRPAVLAPAGPRDGASRWKPRDDIRRAILGLPMRSNGHRRGKGRFKISRQSLESPRCGNFCVRKTKLRGVH
jgi:hypothetical protein